MKPLLALADEVPVTLLVAVACVTLAFLTDPWAPSYARLVEYGAARGLDIVDGEPWRLLSYAFLHGAWWHLLFNLYALLVIGPMLERSIGSLRFAIVYGVTALAGGVAGSLWHDPRSPLVGASGALFGMQGALLALMALAGRTPTEFLASHGGRQLLGTIVVNLAIGFLIPFISNAAHLGGLLAGFAVTSFALGAAAPGHRRSRLLAVTLLLVFVAALFAALHPVWRWDYNVARWAHSSGERRDALRRAFALAIAGDENAVPDEAAMQAEYDQFTALRTLQGR